MRTLVIRVVWAEPGPLAEAAQRRYWARAYEIAAELLVRGSLEAAAAEKTAKEPRQ